MDFRRTEVSVFNVKINSSDNLSSVSFNKTDKRGAVSRTKKNQAFGQQMADSVAILFPILEVNDNDVFDSNVSKFK